MQIDAAGGFHASSQVQARSGEAFGLKTPKYSTTFSLQDVLINVGEKVGSEFEPLSMDIAELVAMVFPPFKTVNTENLYLLLIPFLVCQSFPFVNNYSLQLCIES
jgi:hypothetical protein